MKKLLLLGIGLAALCGCYEQTEQEKKEKEIRQEYTSMAQSENTLSEVVEEECRITDVQQGVIGLGEVYGKEAFAFYNCVYGTDSICYWLQTKETGTGRR